ncbi:MAG: hypothetical protein AB1546_14375, partial [bacterium]
MTQDKDTCTGIEIQPRIAPGFYCQLDNDPDTRNNIEYAIELYLGKHATKDRMDAAQHFEKSLGVFTAFYVKTARQLIREGFYKLNLPQRMFLNFGTLDGRLIQNQSVVEILDTELQDEHKVKNFEVYYMDEWLKQVARGCIPLTSEVAQIKSKDSKDEERERAREKIKSLEKELNDLTEAENLLMESLET